jgi:hypothetical protein
MGHNSLVTWALNWKWGKIREERKDTYKEVPMYVRYHLSTYKSYQKFFRTKP